MCNKQCFIKKLVRKLEHKNHMIQEHNKLMLTILKFSKTENFKKIKKQSFFIFLLLSINFFNCYADRIYVMNSSGYNSAEPQLINAIIANGHTVTVDTTTFNTLPPGFTSTCIDPVNGYDWLCFFGNNDFSGLQTQIQTFIDIGGKVFYQYEITCCTTSSSSVAAILSGLTALPITTNSNTFIANSNLAIPGGWSAANFGCCVNFFGDAYKGLDGLPFTNQLQATSNLNNSSPPISTCLNFGFYFINTDFLGTAKKGAIVGLGDINVWYNGDEPFLNGGVTPVNQSVVNYFFPNNFDTCYLLPPGCFKTYNNHKNISNDTELCHGQTVTLNGGWATSYIWSNGSTAPSINVSNSGTYWVQTGSGMCKSDTLYILVTDCEAEIELPNVFTPNNDGLNDTFNPVKYKEILKANLVIYNRWGQKIFYTDKLMNGWDGTYNNNICSEGIYFWVVEYITMTNEAAELQGFLTLIK